MEVFILSDVFEMSAQLGRGGALHKTTQLES